MLVDPDHRPEPGESNTFFFPRPPAPGGEAALHPTLEALLMKVTHAYTFWAGFELSGQQAAARAIAHMATKGALRGMVVVDEAAHIPDVEVRRGCSSSCRGRVGVPHGRAGLPDVRRPC